MSWASRRRSRDAATANGDQAVDEVATEPVVYVSVPILDNSGHLVDLRIADVSEDQRNVGQSYRSAVGALASSVFTDVNAVIAAAAAAWRGDQPEPIWTTRITHDDVGTAQIDCEVSTSRVGERILQFCSDLSTQHSVSPSEQLLRSVLDHAAVGVMLFRPLLDHDGTITDLRVVWHNDAAVELWGGATMPIGTLYSGFTDDPFLIDASRSVWRGEPFTTLRRLPELGRGDYTTFSQSLQRIDDFLLEVVIDLTDETEAAESLRDLETRFGQTLDSVRDAIAVVRPITDEAGRVTGGEITYVNRVIADRSMQLGLDPVGRTLAELGWPTDSWVVETVARAAAGEHVEHVLEPHEIKRPDFLWFELAHLTFTPMASEVIISIHDLTQLHQSRREVAQALAFDEMLLESIADPALILDLVNGQPRLLAANEAAQPWLPAPSPA